MFRQEGERGNGNPFLGAFLCERVSGNEFHQGAVTESPSVVTVEGERRAGTDRSKGLSSAAAQQRFAKRKGEEFDLSYKNCSKLKIKGTTLPAYKNKTGLDWLQN